MKRKIIFDCYENFKVNIGCVLPPRITLPKNNPNLKLINEALHCSILMASQIDFIAEQQLLVRADSVRPGFLRASLTGLYRVEGLMKKL